MAAKDFEVLKADLDGINLVEASAGTGKTYSIAMLFLRWILSEKYNGNIDSIVAVTFTNYATSELKERISAFLEDALRCLQNRICGKEDKLIRKLCDEIPPESRNDAVKKLKTAVNGFDSASIFTIHGFCRRLILENAFEIRAPFNIELSDSSNIQHETAVDFFRNELSKENDRSFLSAVQSELSVKKFEDLMRKAGNSHEVRIDISKNIVPDDAAREKLASIYSGFLNKIPEITKKNREKNEKMTYDDLILLVYEILHVKEHAQRLKNIMAKRYGLVMIDEFQDTDPVQYFIFRELFFNGNHTVFLIGDPKQSIYSFRNADIFSYLGTSQAVNRKYAMKTNFRSSAQAVNAVNNVFAKIDFGIKEITYSGINPKDSDENPLKLKKESSFIPSPGMLVYEISSDEEIISNIKERIRNMLCPDSNYRLGDRNIKPSDIAILTRTNSFAKEIFDALKSENFPVSFESGSGKGLSVFATPEAKAVLTLIKAAETRGYGEFKALLLTFFYNKTVDDFSDENGFYLQKLYDEFTECFSDWDKKGFYCVFSKFIEKEEILSAIMRSTDGQMLNNVQILNNIRHIAELVNVFETTSGFSPANTADWFAAKLNSQEESSAEDESVRNSYDGSDAVRIMTLHKSKGLEFNIVFFSLSVKNRFPGNEWIPRHDYDYAASDYEKTISLEKSNSQDHSVKGDYEPEETREFYVGVTRAKYLTVYYLRETVYDGTVDKKLRELLEENKINSVKYCKKSDSVQSDAETSFQFEDPLSKYRDLTLREPEKLEREIRAFLSMSSYSGMISASKDEDEYFAEKYEETSQENSGDLPQLSSDALQEGREPLKMSSFPSGKEAGSVLHSILEKVDFSKDDNTDIIREILKKEMDLPDEDLENTVEAVNGCVAAVSNVRMFGGKSLRDAGSRNMSAEMEFFLKVKDDVKKGLVSGVIAGKYPECRIGGDAIQKGFMHGYIDLALKTGGKYYIIDWKSNNLGSFEENYFEEKIEEEMKKHNYYLQYMIYLAAFDKYISSIDPDYSYSENFGGVRYVFLRGVNADNEKSGIFYDCPEEALLREFQQLFEGEK